MLAPSRMSVLSKVSGALFSIACSFALASAGACGTDAKGVDDCRDIEQARCTAAKNCGTVSDVAECQRFYRDQCLHGLAVNSPGPAIVKKCVETIHQAGLCATQGVSTLLGDCTNMVTDSPTTAKTACDVVSTPEVTSECSFLIPTPDAGAAGSGGSGGSAGSAGSAGSGGSASEAAGAGGEGGA